MGIFVIFVYISADFIFSIATNLIPHGCHYRNPSRRRPDFPAIIKRPSPSNNLLHGSRRSTKPTTTCKPLPPQKQLPFATPSILHSPEKAKPPSTPPEPPWQPFMTIVNTTLKPKNARHSLSISVSLSHFPLHTHFEQPPPSSPFKIAGKRQRQPEPAGENPTTSGEVVTASLGFLTRHFVNRFGGIAFLVKCSLTSVPESRRRVVIRGEVVIASLLRLLYRIFRATLVAGFLGGTFPPVDLLVFCVSDVEHGGGCCEVFRRGGKKKRVAVKWAE